MAWIKRRKTAERYDVSVRTIERWEVDPKLNYPKSMIRNGRRYDSEEALDAWDAECAAAGRVTRPPPATGKRKAGAAAEPVGA
jgi:hypothetical protein